MNPYSENLEWTERLLMNKHSLNSYRRIPNTQRTQHHYIPQEKNEQQKSQLKLKVATSKNHRGTPQPLGDGRSKEQSHESLMSLYEHISPIFTAIATVKSKVPPLLSKSQLLIILQHHMLKLLQLVKPHGGTKNKRI